MPDHRDGLRLVRDALLDHDTLVRAVLSGRREKPRKIVIRPVRLRAGRRLQITAQDGKRNRTRNLTGAAFEGELDALLDGGWRSLHVATATKTISVRVSKRGKVFVHTEPAKRTVDLAHDRPKHRLLAPDADFLKVLGVAGPDGRIHADKQAKYRQIDKFLRLLQEVLPLDRLPRPVRLVDLGCGSADLTFGAYHLLNHVLGIAAEVEGVDVDAHAAARNCERARELGWAGLRFVRGRIIDFEPRGEPHVVLALHACDTATDEALARVVGWRSDVVLAAPCCHHDLQGQLSVPRAPRDHRALVRDAILLQRFGDLLTDTLRASLLRIHGYRTDVIQFVASEHTARNVMIRAVRTGLPPSPADVTDYQQLRDAWQVMPALERALATY